MYSHTTHRSNSAHPIPLFPLLIPIKSWPLQKKVLPFHFSIAISVHASLCVPPSLPSHLASLTLSSASRPYPIIFRTTKKISDNKIRDAGESEGRPRGDPAILISLRPTFRPPPLIAVTCGGCHSPLTFPPRRSLNPTTTTTTTQLISFRAPAVHTHTHAREILILISEWYDWICSRGEKKKKQKQQR